MHLLKERVKLKRIFGAVVSLVLMMPLTNTLQAAEIMRCSHQLSPNSHIAKVIDQWAAEIETLSENDIDVQINGANSLVMAPRNIAAVRAGELECAFSNNRHWTESLPLMDITLEPFALRNVEILKKWRGSPAANLLEQKILETGLTNVAWLFTTWRTAITSNGRHIIKPSDFKGVRIQGLGPISNAAFEALGAIPVDMSDKKAYVALENGDLDAGLTNVSSALSARYFEVQDHVTILPLFTLFYNGYVNTTWYNALPEKSKQAIREASARAAIWAIEASEISAAAAPNLLKDEDMQVYVATQPEIEALKNIMRPAFNKKFLSTTGQLGSELITLVDEM